MHSSNIGTQTNVFLSENQQISADTALLPFRRTPGSFWTTNECRDTTTLGYTYPELQRWKFASDESYQDHAASVVTELYSGRLREQMVTTVVQKRVTVFGQMLAEKNNVFTDWSVETRVLASAFPGTFRVQFLLLQDDDGAADVGSWMVLMPSYVNDPVSPPSTGEAADKILSGTTSLTSQLIDHVNNGTLASLDSGDVVPYLRYALRWSVLDVSTLSKCLLWSWKLILTG
jgi:tyrosinase